MINFKKKLKRGLFVDIASHLASIYSSQQNQFGNAVSRLDLTQRKNAFPTRNKFHKKV